MNKEKEKKTRKWQTQQMKGSDTHQTERMSQNEFSFFISMRARINEWFCCGVLFGPLIESADVWKSR